MTETGRPKSQRDRVKFVKTMLDELDDPSKAGVPKEKLLEVTVSDDYSQMQIEHTIENLLHKGEIYQPQDDHYAPT